MSFLQPQVQQGNLNRLYTAIVVPNFINLNVTASYMSKGQAHVTFNGKATNQIPTATGIVNSQEPFVMAGIDINLLRSQTLAAAWLAQFQTQSILGPVEVYSDSSAFPMLPFANVAIENVDPGPYDGTDPTIKFSLSGTFYINSAMWTGDVLGSLGAIVGGLGAVASIL